MVEAAPEADVLSDAGTGDASSRGAPCSEQVGRFSESWGSEEERPSLPVEQTQRVAEGVNAAGQQQHEAPGQSHLVPEDSKVFQHSERGSMLSAVCSLLP
jgi:hypothetical protein